ncbi:MAG: hypothetical protein JNL21_05955 [Myxococcales bacterium]|nr:hypothetical protein [Myxococcales bacterium]
MAKAKRTGAVVFHLALCHENLDKLALALEGFTEAEALASAEGPGSADVREKAARRKAALEERVPTLRVVLPKGSSATVAVNDKPWTAAMLEREARMEPGKARVVVEDKGRVVFEKTVTLDEGERETVRVTVASEAPVEVEKPKPIEDETPELEPGNKVPAIVVGAVGLGALAGGAVLFGLGQAAVAEVKETCNADFAQCDPDKEEVASRGEVFHYTSIGLAAGGAVMLGVATALWFTVGADAPKSGGKAAPVSLSVGPTGARMSLSF